MSTEKKSVLVALCISAAVTVALFIAMIFCAAQTGKLYPAAVIFFFFAVFFLYAIDRAEEFESLCEEPKILAAYEAAHRRPPAAILPTRIAAIVNRQRRNQA